MATLLDATDTQNEDTADPNTVKSNIENYLEGNLNTPSNSKSHYLSLQ